MAEPRWWQRGIVYQVYPRSFQDSNGDGVGDLNGITARLDYLKWLGVDAVWISPIFVSPMADFGYDVADYRAIEPIFGTMEDFDRLLAETHARGLKLILDFVPNHSSDQHPWFLESRSSRTNPKRDWYIWRDPAPDGGPPNNWISNFGGSAWEWDETTGQYYYHAFLKEQADLNWRNPELRAAMYDVLRFWLDRGVDGFRVDVIWHLGKDPEFRDNPPNPAYRPGQPDIASLLQVYSCDRPEVHDYVAEMRSVIEEYDDRLLIGEIYLPMERLVAYYGRDLRGAHLPFNFQLIKAPWNAQGLAQLISEYEAAIPDGGWPNWVLSNHDQKRVATRVGLAQARVAAMLLLTLRGTPTLYYGDEIGMENVVIPPERAVDCWERTEPGLGFSRDPQRTPMQWDSSVNAGFTTGIPWLPQGEDAQERCVARERDDPTSMLTLTRRLIDLRRAHPALAIGRYIAFDREGDVLGYRREENGETFVVLLNLAHEPVRETLPREFAKGRIILSTFLDRENESVDGAVDLRGDEGTVIALSR